MTIVGLNYMSFLGWILLIALIINSFIAVVVVLYLHEKRRLMGSTYPVLKKYGVSFRDLIRQIPGNLYWKNLEGVLVADNTAHSRSFSNSDDLTGITDYDIFPKEVADKVRALDHEVMRTGRLHVAEEFATGFDGKRYLYLSYKAPLYNSKGELVGIIGNSLDISEARKAEMDRLWRDIERLKGAEKALIEAKEAAEKASRAKSEFIAVMSHEFRTPLTGILGMLDILLNEQVSDEQRKEYLQNVNAVSRHLLSLINNILDFAKIDAKKFHLNNVDFDLKHEIQEIIRILNSQALNKHISLQLNYPGVFPVKFRGDPKALSQILMNVIGNAVKFTEQGTVTISVIPKELIPRQAHLWILVEDTGIGIPPEKIEKIFEAFEQADISHTRSYGGTGLGLAVARRLIEIMGGSIWVESIVNHGAKFYLDLTFERNPLEAFEEKESSVEPHKRLVGPCRVLLVEDDPLVQFVHQHKLEKLGCDVVAVKDGVSALSAYEADKFDIIFMDIGLPDISGNEVIRWIRKIESALDTSTPIVALSAYADEKNTEEMLAAGANLTLCKPVEDEKLLEVIESLVRRSTQPLKEKSE
ncbi:MAG: two component system sensor kinase, hybrid [Gammaproteobacteria bacterium]|jgi:signal transduction histidine kinase/CheY-like chemotaxis protein|nr:two component system sensor kinase, hybrid [Gammaproteobacteria bacterium]